MQKYVHKIKSKKLEKYKSTRKMLKKIALPRQTARPHMEDQMRKIHKMKSKKYRNPTVHWGKKAHKDCTAALRCQTHIGHHQPH